MKIVLTGGGTGGHFYPIIAVAEQLQKKLQAEGLNTGPSTPVLYYMGPEVHDKELLEVTGLNYIHIPAGKMRRYFSLQNILDIFVVMAGVLKALWKLFLLYPDVIFAKGAYGSVPVLLAGRVLRIPIVIHESDSVPGRANKWAGTFAVRIALSYKDAATYFPAGKVAHTGQPVREHIQNPIKEGSFEYFNIEPEAPVILILGGSQGAQNINSAILNALPDLLSKYTVIHQTGKGNLSEVTEVARTVLLEHEHADRYVPRGSLNDTELARSAGVANLIISRAGSTIFEIARWGIPSIIVPIENSNGDHQRSNAFAYAKTGAATVIEESNLTTNILLSEIHRILDRPDTYASMSSSTRSFVYPDAGSIIANELYSIARSH